jgi:hypothetical protein
MQDEDGSTPAACVSRNCGHGANIQGGWSWLSLKARKDGAGCHLKTEDGAGCHLKPGRMELVVTYRQRGWSWLSLKARKDGAGCHLKTYRMVLPDCIASRLFRLNPLVAMIRYAARFYLNRTRVAQWLRIRFRSGR